MADKVRWSREVVDALWTEGRGKGELEKYKPWIRRNEISTKNSFREGQPCLKIGGLQKMMLSRLEQRGFLPADIAKRVEDIWEQFPMDPELTRICAEQAGIPHPRYANTNIDAVLSTDFVLKMRGGKLVAIQVKPASELEKPDVLARLEIERRYWKALDIPWYILTEAEVPETVFKNVRAVHNQALVATSREEHYLNEFVSTSRQVFDALQRYPTEKLSKAAEKIDRQFGFDGGTSLMHALELIYRGNLVPDWNVPIANQLVHTLVDRAVHVKVVGGTQ